VCVCVYGNSNSFKIKVGMYQGSAMSLLLFVIVMEATTREFKVGFHSSCCMLMSICDS